MKRESILYTAASLLLGSAVCVWAADWKPTFEDKPVSEKDRAAIEAALPTDAMVEPTENRRVLVFSATAGYRHPSIPYGKIAMARIGEKSGAYEAVVSDDPANFEPDILRDFDAVLLLNPTQDFFMPSHKRRGDFSPADWKALQDRQVRLVDNLVNFVKEGGGLVGVHSATDACYRHQAFGETIGGYFNGHPWNAGNKVTIVIEDPEHGTMKPVFGDMKDFSFKEEIYQFKEEPYSREKVRVLLSVDPERSDKVKKLKRKDNDYPVAWVQKVGKGRVFYTSIGHNPHMFWNPLMLKHYLAGIQFAAGDLLADTTPSTSK